MRVNKIGVSAHTLIKTHKNMHISIKAPFKGPRGVLQLVHRVCLRFRGFTTLHFHGVQTAERNGKNCNKANTGVKLFFIQFGTLFTFRNFVYKQILTCSAILVSETTPN